MPTYAFICNPEKKGCGHRYEVDLMMSEISKYKPVCPKCKKKVSRQDYSGISIFGPVKTLGSIADKNTDKMSDDYKKMINDKNNAYRKQKYTGPIPEGGYIKDDR